MTSTALHVLKVFVGRDGRGGNALGVFVDGTAIPAAERQAVAADLGFSETVFVEDVESGAVRIHTPSTELGFAGHPLVGTAWLLARIGRPVDVLRPPAGDVPTFQAAGLRWIRARADWVHGIELRQLESVEDVDALDAGDGRAWPAWLDEGVAHAHVWAWVDPKAGVVRARGFAPGLGIAEDEATGAAAVLMTSALGRALEIRQGVGSMLRTRLLDDGQVEVGGRVALVEERPYP